MSLKLLMVMMMRKTFPDMLAVAARQAGQMADVQALVFCVASHLPSRAA